MLYIFLSLLAGSVFCQDFIIESLTKSINHNSDPCDNFYRHACPLNSSIDHFDWHAQEELPVEPFDSYTIVRDFPRKPENPISDVVALLKDLCENGNSTALFFVDLEREMKPCAGPGCLLHLSFDENCSRVTEKLNQILTNWYPEEFNEHTENLFKFLNIQKGNAKNITTLMNLNLQLGLRETLSILDLMKETIRKWIIKTPWTENHNATDMILAAAEITVMQSNYEEVYLKASKYLELIEGNYTECKINYNNYESANTLCFMVSVGNVYEEGYSDFTPYSLEDTAFNAYPYLAFSLPHFHLMQNTVELAAKLGASGFIVGHELAHTLIESRNGTVLSVFSEQSIECIQKQYNSTCTEFEEVSCITTEEQIDENGADILGLQLAYSLLEEEYGDRLKNIYHPLNVTYQQLFFYSFAIALCDPFPIAVSYKGENQTMPDEHSSLNNIINAAAQHPGFKDAFQCDDESRMMRSAVKQCIIYGENAPLTRKKK